MTRGEEHVRQYRIIFELLHRNSRIYIKAISRNLGTDPNTASRRLKEAFKQGYIVGPQVRKNSSSNFGEHVYLLHCADPRNMYLKYREDSNVVYHAVLTGAPSLWIISKKEMDFEDVMVSGLRSDYYVSFPPNHSWKTSIQIMKEKIQKFNPKKYKPKGIIKNRWNESVEWDSQDEILFGEFKFNMRKKFSPIMKKHHISAEKIYEWFEKLPKCCTTALFYFPDQVSSYDPYLFIFETDYEDFIIELFSEFPTSCFFFKVSDRLILYVYMKKEFLRFTWTEKNDFSKLHINLLIMDLLKKGILKSEVHAIVEYAHLKEI